jgi:hypothetical protein
MQESFHRCKLRKPAAFDLRFRWMEWARCQFLLLTRKTTELRSHSLVDSCCFHVGDCKMDWSKGFCCWSNGLIYGFVLLPVDAIIDQWPAGKHRGTCGSVTLANSYSLLGNLNHANSSAIIKSTPGHYRWNKILSTCVKLSRSLGLMAPAKMPMDLPAPRHPLPSTTKP